MRLELSGSFLQRNPVLIPFIADQNWDPSEYIASGYTHFEVICIGAGGGHGGGIDTENTGTLVRNYGGEGGGGGYHRIRGLLSALPSSVPVVVGAVGDPGLDNTSNPALTTDGADGGYSSFNGTTCRASGGKGGKRAQSNSLTVTTQAHGGEGGVGNHIIAGGGAAGGLAGTPTATGPGTPGTNGTDGTLLQDIGKGGGGGAGGVGKYGAGGTTCNAATNGGRGTYNSNDISVYGPGTAPEDDPDTGSQNTVPGTAGGAKAAPLNGLPVVYGRSGEDGIVILRLTAE